MKDNGQTGGRFRRKRTNFSMVSNAPIRDENLSLKAKGLYTLIQSYITLEDFILYKGYLMRRCKEKEKAFESAWKELKQSGYLVQYQLHDQSGRIYYEYELMDFPQASSREHAKSTIPPKKEGVEKGPSGGRTQWKTHPVGNGGDLINTDSNNTLSNNTSLTHINHSGQQGYFTIEQIQEQIGYHDILFSYPDINMEILNEICLLIQEVMNTHSDETIRVNGRNMKANLVQVRFKMLKLEHIAFVIDKMNLGVSDVKNTKAYMVTVLYNAPLMTHSEINYQVSYDMANY